MIYKFRTRTPKKNSIHLPPLSSLSTEIKKTNWTEEEEKTVMKLYRSGVMVNYIARYIGRSKCAVKEKIARMRGKNPAYDEKKAPGL